SRRPGGSDAGTARRSRLRRADPDAAHRDPFGRGRRADRRRDSGLARDDVLTGGARDSGPRYRPAEMARADAGLDSHAARLGALGALARPPSLARDSRRRARGGPADLST